MYPVFGFASDKICSRIISNVQGCPGKQEVVGFIRLSTDDEEGEQNGALASQSSFWEKPCVPGWASSLSVICPVSLYLHSVPRFCLSFFFFSFLVYWVWVCFGMGEEWYWKLGKVEILISSFREVLVWERRYQMCSGPHVAVRPQVTPPLWPCHHLQSGMAPPR